LEADGPLREGDEPEDGRGEQRGDENRGGHLQGRRRGLEGRGQGTELAANYICSRPGVGQKPTRRGRRRVTMAGWRPRRRSSSSASLWPSTISSCCEISASP